MDWQNRIVLDAAVLAGKPVIKGTRLSVAFILDLRIGNLIAAYLPCRAKPALACLLLCHAHSAE